MGERVNAILPNNPDGTKTMEDHAIDSSNSPYISMTRDRDIAEDFAVSGSSASGYVVEIDGLKLLMRGTLREHMPSTYGPIARENVLNESEVLNFGPIPLRTFIRMYKAPAQTWFQYYELSN